MTPEQAREHIERQERELAGLQTQLAEVASRHAGAVVLAMLDVIIVQLAGRPEFVTNTRIRIYRAVLQSLASKGIQ